MKRHARPRTLRCSLLLLISNAFLLPAMGQTPPFCPPGGEEQDYGTGCGSNPSPPPDYLSVLWSAGWAPTATRLSAAERTALFSAADQIRDRIRDYLNDPTQFHRLAVGQDYFSTSPTSEWRRWYDTQRNDLMNSRLLYWAIYASSQEISPADRARALQGMLDATALLAKGHLLFGQQFLIRARNLRYTAPDLLSSLDIIHGEQCFVSGRRFEATCDYNDVKANAEYQFEEVLTDYTRIFSLDLSDGTTLGQRLGVRELDLFRLAIERSAQDNDLMARNLFALDQTESLRQRIIEIYRDVVAARYVQTVAVIAPLVQGPREQALTLATQLTGLRQSAQKLMQNMNPLGFDLSFSPLLGYGEAYTLTRDALDGNGGALRLEELTHQASVDYNLDLLRQRQELANLRNTFHSEISSLCGITITEAATLRADDIGVACNNDQSLVRSKFEFISINLASVAAVEERLRAIPERLRITLERNRAVVHAIYTSGVELAAIDYETALLQSVSVSLGASVSFPFSIGVSASISFNPHRQELAALASTRQMIQAATQIAILGTDNEAAVRNSLLDEAYEIRNLEIEVAKVNAATVEYNNTLNRLRANIALRDQAARDIQQSHETIDVLRLQTNRACLDAVLKFDDAVKRSFILAKVVEYETVFPLTGGTLDPRNLFRFRRATELNNYVSALNQYYVFFDWSSYLNRFYYPYISVGRDLLGYNSNAMRCDASCRNCQGSFFDGLVTCNGDRDVLCQARLFKEFVRRNTSGPPERRTVAIEFSTPLDSDRSYACQPGSIFLSGVGGAKLAGVGVPLPESRGVALTFRTSQPNLQTIAMRLTQSGHSLFKNARGCAVELAPRHPLAFLDYPSPVSADTTTAPIQACLETDDRCFLPTRSFLRRSVYSSNWRLELQYGPGSDNPALDINQLEDITLAFDTTGFTASPVCR